jgi:hypothetical protein
MACTYSSTLNSTITKNAIDIRSIATLRIIDRRLFKKVEPDSITYMKARAARHEEIIALISGDPTRLNTLITGDPILLEIDMLPMTIIPFPPSLLFYKFR